MPMLETCHCCITCPKREAEAQARLATESRCHGRIVVSMNPIDGQPLSAIAHTDSVNIPLVFETVHGMYQACGSFGFTSSALRNGAWNQHVANCTSVGRHGGSSEIAF